MLKTIKLLNCKNLININYVNVLYQTRQMSILNKRYLNVLAKKTKGFELDKHSFENTMKNLNDFKLKQQHPVSDLDLIGKTQHDQEGKQYRDDYNRLKESITEIKDPNKDQIISDIFNTGEYDPNKYNFIHELMTDQEKDELIMKRIENLDDPTTQEKYEEYMMRLMLEDIKQKKKAQVYVSDVLIHTPEYQDYNNELERNIHILNAEYRNDPNPECKLKTHRFIKQRNQLVNEITRKHYQRVSQAFEIKLEQVNNTLSESLKTNNNIIKQQQQTELNNEDEFDVHISNFLKSEKLTSLDTIPEDIKNLVQDELKNYVNVGNKLLAFDEDIMKSMAGFLPESNQDKIDQFQENGLMVESKSTIPRTQIKLEKPLTFQEIIQQTKKQHDNLKKHDKSNYIDGDFNLKEILSNLQNKNNIV